MNSSLIQEIVEAIEPKLFDREDLRNLSFYEGAFNVFSAQNDAGRLDKELLHTYLSSFLDEEWIAKEILEKVNPELLSELTELLSATAKAGV